MLLIIMHNGDNDFYIDHISKEKLECAAQLLYVVDVVDDVTQLFYSNASTNDANNGTDDKQTQT